MIKLANNKKSRGETPRRKAHLPAKAGKRHVPNWNHPRARSEDQQRAMQKGMR